MLASRLRQIFQSSPFLSGSNNINSHVFSLSVMHATCANHLVRVYLIIVTVSDEEYKL
jgi:hypothetical protein